MDTGHRDGRQFKAGLEGNNKRTDRALNGERNIIGVVLPPGRNGGTRYSTRLPNATTHRTPAITLAMSTTTDTPTSQ